MKLRQINKYFSWLVVLSLLVSCEGVVCPQQGTSVGPEKGWLILHGGGRKQEYEHYRRFAALAGGANASVVVILTAADLDVFPPDFPAKWKHCSNE